VIVKDPKLCSIPFHHPNFPFRAEKQLKLSYPSIDFRTGTENLISFEVDKSAFRDSILPAL